MLSDSLFEILEDLKSALDHYNYATDYREEIVQAAAILNHIVYRLDRLKSDCTLSVSDFEVMWREIFDRIIAKGNGL